MKPYVPHEADNRRMMGRRVATGIVFLAALLALGNLWYQHRATDETQHLLGTAGMLLVTDSQQIDLWDLAVTRANEAVATDDRIEVGETLLRRGRRHSRTGAPGISNLRYAMRQDFSYDFAAPPPTTSQWGYLLRFTDGDDHVRENHISLVLDLVQGRVAVVETGRQAGLSSSLQSGLTKFITETTRAQDKK
jgi:hypothetical protein